MRRLVAILNILLFFFLFDLIKCENAAENTFSRIYDSKAWGPDGLGSGYGSSLEYTDITRRIMFRFFQHYGIHTMVDAPCGSFLWMRVLLSRNPQINYTGLDVVPAVIDRLKNEFKLVTRWRFHHADLSKASFRFPSKPDLIFSRDMFQHLPLSLILRILRNMVIARPRYIMLGAYKSGTNTNITIGDYFSIDWLVHPFFFINPMLEYKERADNPQKFLYVYNRTQFQKWNLRRKVPAHL